MNENIKIVADCVFSCKARIEHSMRLALTSEDASDAFMELVRAWADLDQAIKAIEPELPF